MFSGRFEYAIDEKSRVSIPAKFRESLNAGHDLPLVLTNLDGCIVAYPYQEWLDIQERMSNPVAMRPDQRAFLRYFFSGASECALDKLGRVLVPQTLRTDALIKKNIVIVGSGRKIEIWAKEEWDKLVEQVKADPEKIAIIASELGL